MKKGILSILLLVVTISMSAQESKIIGNWQLFQVVHKGETVTGLKTVFIFAEKGKLKAARSATSKPMKVGTWEYNKKEKIIAMSSTLDKDFNGEATIVKLDNNKLEYNKDGAILSFKKIAEMYSPPVITVEKPTLLFELEDMLDEEDAFDYYAEASKLPWKIESIIGFLKTQHEVMYQVTGFPDNQDPDTWVQSSKINFNEDEQTIDVREYSHFQNDYIDMMEDPILMNELENYQEEFYFFPKENLDYFKVVGSENVATAIGDFECTVVEGFGSFNDKVKYWMVNEKPGVFAKIVIKKDVPEGFGGTKLFLLKEIK